LGIYAVDLLIEVNFITPSDEDFDIEVLSLLAINGKISRQLTAKIKDEGIVYSK
jgi:hypothetical protein